jgi:heme exporter protein A
MTSALLLRGNDLRKVFNRRSIFTGVSFEVAAGQTLLITGRNGSGKSTLAKIVTDLLSPTAGTVDLLRGGALAGRHRQVSFGFVAPYLQVYDEFTAVENVDLSLRLRGLRPLPGAGARLLGELGLGGREGDPVRTFSSGMKQRVKYACALIHEPAVLVLDEPMSNLDADGTAMVRAVMANQLRRGILVVATNDLTDVGHHDQRVDLHARA